MVNTLTLDRSVTKLYANIIDSIEKQSISFIDVYVQSFLYYWPFSFYDHGSLSYQCVR